jgi:hypothetical protein
MNVYLASGPPEPSAKSLDETALCAPTPGRPLQDPLVVDEGLDQDGNPGAVGGIVLQGATSVQFQLVDGVTISANTSGRFFLVSPLEAKARSAVLVDRKRHPFARCRIDYQQVLGPVVETCVN